MKHANKTHTLTHQFRGANQVEIMFIAALCVYYKPFNLTIRYIQSHFVRYARRFVD